ncbi:NAD(P)H-dependent oxidoreductase [Pectinatus haikarae]|uniref:Multimeric flavodoxin WrbA n=1 Tax=Pectinatus haikarae TaxID=349096 RepID=A0ABT9YA78_9FIRM|nr:NAD(P)H-dependent oxidoreductase [Pectinatus haikarae]MDQ0204745.1 multimeric flavodoxin WrbA [Pectinatus haikarae]
MNRREFLKVSGMGTLTLFLSGCGLSALAGETENESKIPEKGSVSGGKNMKIVVINSSPHPKNESTSIYLSEKFTEGAKSAGHEVFTFDAANEETHPCRGCDKCHMDGPCIWSDAIEQTLMPKMLDADLLVLVTPLYYFGMSAQLKTIVDRFYSRTGKLHGKKSVLMATAYNSADWTMSALVDHYDTLVRYMEWNDVGKVLGIGCGARSLVERSEFGDQAYKIGANL